SYEDCVKYIKNCTANITFNSNSTFLGITELIETWKPEKSLPCAGEDLISSIRLGNLEGVKKYLTAANINKQDSRSNTPLIIAALNGHQEIVAFLLSKGAVIETK